MVLSTRLDLRQVQSLVMTPQLQQAIKLLQLSNLELTDYITNELEQNPLLEKDDGVDTEGDRENDGDPVEKGDGEAESLDGENAVVADVLDTNYDNLWSSDTGGGGGVGIKLPFGERHAANPPMPSPGPARNNASAAAEPTSWLTKFGSAFGSALESKFLSLRNRDFCLQEPLIRLQRRPSKGYGRPRAPAS